MKSDRRSLATGVGRTAIAWLTYPSALIGSVWLGGGLLDGGLSPAGTVACVGAAFLVLCFALERVSPETPRWDWSRLELRTDALHALLTNTIPSALFRLLFYSGLVGLADAFDQRLGSSLWPDGAPRLVQLALALLLAEAAAYAIHRGLHRSRLWPLHAVHHSSRRFYFLLAARKHPIQAFVTYGGRLSVLWVVGVPADVIALYTCLAAAASYVQHANLHLRTGVLGWVFATPELHRLHHGREPSAANCNFGDVLIVYDVLFGTRRTPPPAEALHDGLGLPDEIAVDHHYRGHLALPFVWPASAPAADTAGGASSDSS